MTKSSPKRITFRGAVYQRQPNKIRYKAATYILAEPNVPTLSSKQAKELDGFIGFHCQKHERQPLDREDKIFKDYAGGNLSYFEQIFSALPFSLRGEVLENDYNEYIQYYFDPDEGFEPPFNINYPPGEYDDGFEEWSEFMEWFFDKHDIKWIFVSENSPLTDYGDHCYAVIMDTQKTLLDLHDLGVNDAAMAYVYDANVVQPKLIEIEAYAKED